MNCPHCGKTLKDGAKFCIYCGEKIESSMPFGNNGYQNGGALQGGGMPRETGTLQGSMLGNGVVPVAAAPRSDYREKTTNARPSVDSDKTVSLFEMKKEQASQQTSISSDTAASIPASPVGGSSVMPSGEAPAQKPLPFTDVYGQNSTDINSAPAYDYTGNNSNISSNISNSTYDYGKQSYEAPAPAPFSNASSINNKPLLIIVIILALLVAGIGVYLGIFFAGNSTKSNDKSDKSEEAAIRIEQEGSFGWETLAGENFILED